MSAERSLSTDRASNPAPVASSSSRLLVVCAWCERVRASADLWREPRPGEEDGARISHGICPECIIQWTSAITREGEKR